MAESSPHTMDEAAAIERFKAAASKSETAESRERGSAFVPKPGDVFIVTPPKCGTTWVQQIVQMLRSRGSMDFDEISLVIPCLEMALDYGYEDLNAPQGWEPRAYKTHFWHDHCPQGEGVKYIYVIRDPRDAAVSFFHFFEGWFFPYGAISLQAFLEQFFLRRHIPSNLQEFPSIWQHMLSWWPRRRDPNVLWLFFEDLKDHPQQVVELIASFIGTDTSQDPELLQVAVERSSIQYMKEQSRKFDEHHLKLRINEQCGLDKMAGLCGRNNGKVREGKVGGWQAEMPQALQEAFEARWRGEVLPETGYATYAELRAAVNMELKRPWAK